MTIIGFGIVPHGAIILPDKDRNLDKKCIILHEAMKTLNKEINLIKPDIIFVSTPHGISLQHDFGIYLNETGEGDAEWLGEFLEYKIDIMLNKEISSDLLLFLKSKNHLVQGITAFTPSVPIQLRWGEVVPIFFLSEIKTKYIIMSHPTRRYNEATSMIEELKQIGFDLFHYFNKLPERVFVLISGDLAHTHQKEGPYGYSEQAELFDNAISDWIKSSVDENLIKEAASYLELAKSCGFTGFTILQGMLNESKVESFLLAIEHPTYYGMAVASFKINL